MKLYDLGTAGGMTILGTIDLLDPISGAEALFWTDEHDYTPTVAQHTQSLDGALIIEQAQKLAGRPITLEGFDSEGWFPRSTVEQLRDWASTPLRRFKLKLEYDTDTREFIVVFRHQDKAVEAVPVIGFDSTHLDTDYFKVTLRFTQVG